MSNPRISTVLLYIVAAVSLIVILFFYVGPKTVSDYAKLEKQYEELTTGGDMQMQDTEPVADSMATDTTSADTASVAGTDMAESDTTSAVASQGAAVAPYEVEVTDEVDLRDHFSGWELMVLNRTDYALIWAYILFAITLVAAVVFPLINVVTNPKSLIQTLAVLAGAAVLIVLSYFVFASDTPIKIIGYAGTDNSNPVTLKWVDTGLFSTYILFGVAILSILYSEIASLFK